jgi:hypothetical protein
MSTRNVEWSHYRDRAWKIASDASTALEALVADADNSGNFPPDHINSFGDPDNAAVARARHIILEADKLICSIGESLTFPMTREEAANFQDHS